MTVNFCNAYVFVYVSVRLCVHEPLLELLIKTQQQNKCQNKTTKNLYMVESINFCARILV